MYTPMGWIPETSIASTTKSYSHSPPAPRFSVGPIIRHAAWWWKPSRTLRISSVTTQIFLLYNSTNCSTSLYISHQYRTVSPILSITLDNVPHTASNISASFVRSPPNRFYCRRLSILGMGKPPTVTGTPH